MVEFMSHTAERNPGDGKMFDRLHTETPALLEEYEGLEDDTRGGAGLEDYKTDAADAINRIKDIYQAISDVKHPQQDRIRDKVGETARAGFTLDEEITQLQAEDDERIAAENEAAAAHEG